MSEIIDKKVWIYDIETLSNMFSYIGYNVDTKYIRTFVIHESRNDLIELIKHFKDIKGEIGFNNLSFDSQVTQFIINNYKDWLELSGEEISNLIYNQAQKTIEISNKMGFPEFPEWKLSIPQLDLYKIWHFDNVNKRTSLKFIEYSIDMPNIEEMPIHHRDNIKESQIQSILNYNMNDVYATYEFYRITIGETNHSLYKGINKIQLRKDIQKTLGIKCINFNDVRIGDEINKLNYSKLTGLDKKKFPKPNKIISKFYFKDCYPSYYKFETLEFNNFINAVGNIEVKLKKSKTKTIKDQEFEFTFNGTTYLMAKGGLHSKDKPRIIKPNNDEFLKDCDVGSMYPNAIRKRKLFPRHLGSKWLEGYTNIIQERIKSKILFKETKEGKYKAIDEAFKLSLNGGSFGKTNEEHNWQFDPRVTFNTTIGSQIDLLMLIEVLEINKIHVISANTDGLVCLFNKSLEETYYNVCKEWEVKVGNNELGQLEYTDYKFMIQTSVNDYITIKTNGDIKTKGDFVSEFEIHKNKSKRIVPLALQQYFINNIPIQDTIRNHKNIFDFCLGAKSIGSNRLIHLEPIKGTEIKLQKINRYYVSTNGWHLLKRLPAIKKFAKQLDIFGVENNGERESEIEAGWLTTIYNRHVEGKSIESYNINYKYYEEQCNKIIDKIQGNEI